MLIFKLFLLQFSAHLLSDFIFQPQTWSDHKSKRIVTRHHLYHISIVFVSSYILSFDFGFWKAALVLTSLHFITDILKSYLQIDDKTNVRSYFFLDQLIHLVILILVTYVYDYCFGIDFLVNIETKTIAIITGCILCTKPANIIIKNLFITFSINIPNDDETDSGEKSIPNAGKLIGITERLLALALIILGQYEAVGLIIAAKSILRFSDPLKSEYVLVGTLLSFGIAAFTGILINIL